MTSMLDLVKGLQETRSSKLNVATSFSVDMHAYRRKTASRGWENTDFLLGSTRLSASRSRSKCIWVLIAPPLSWLNPGEENLCRGLCQMRHIHASRKVGENVNTISHSLSVWSNVEEGRGVMRKAHGPSAAASVARLSPH